MHRKANIWDLLLMLRDVFYYYYYFSWCISRVRVVLCRHFPHILSYLVRSHTQKMLWSILVNRFYLNISNFIKINEHTIFHLLLIFNILHSASFWPIVFHLVSSLVMPNRVMIVIFRTFLLHKHINCIRLRLPKCIEPIPGSITLRVNAVIIIVITSNK